MPTGDTFIDAVVAALTRSERGAQHALRTAEIVREAVLAAGVVLLEGVEMYGDTTCPHCLGNPDQAPEDCVDQDTGLCGTCRGHGEGVFLAYLES